MIRKIVLLPLLIGGAVAVVYYAFEGTVSLGLEFFWEDVFDTDDHRLLIIPIITVLSLAYFYLRHRWQGRAEHSETGLLGDTPKPTLRNLLHILIIGFFSLVAGASLGPEAVLIPACVVVGAYTARKFSETNTKPYEHIGFVALFAAFFSSVYAALLGMFLLRQQTKLSLFTILGGLASSIVTVIVLNVLETDTFFDFPDHDWSIQLENLLVYALLFVSGMLAAYGLVLAEKLYHTFTVRASKSVWWRHALIATVGLSFLYLIGGSLVQFTGNESIRPMLDQASELGVFGLLWLVLIKLLAISWSKTIGYTGGLIFPMVFVSATLTAIALRYDSDISFIIGLFCVLFGAVFVNRKQHVLF